MKLNMLMLLSLVAVVVFSNYDAFGQFVWTRDTQNPVFSGGGTGAWDNDVAVPWVIFNSDSARYEMWYTGPNPSGRIGFAISSDGMSWKREVNPVLSPSPGTWDSLLAGVPCVLRENGQYKMWYTGTATNSSGTAVGTKIGYATSPDGRDWTKYAGNPVFTPGASTWEAGGVAYCSVIKSAGGYVMFYNGCIANANLNRIGRATSVDGITWQRETLHNPVLDIGGPGAWDGNVYLPRVLDVGGTYYMWYTAETIPGDNFPRIGLATSADSGKTWVKFAQNPVLTMGLAGSWDERWVELGSVFFKNSFHMWYDGGALPYYLGRVGHATAPLLATVRRVPSQYSTIQAAINAANNGDTVLVSDGTYYENIRFKGKKIVVGSMYLTTSDTSHISKTIIDGSHSTSPDSGSVVYFINGEDTTSVLCGFTIKGGTGTKIAKWSSLEGGGVLCYESGARMTKNIITGNVLYDNLDRYGLFGAGVSADGTGGEVLLMEGNLVAANSGTSTAHSASGGGVGGVYINIILRQNVITDNVLLTQTTTLWAAGGGVYTEQGSLFADGNLIARNKALCPAAIGGYLGSGGGVFCEAVTLDFRNNRVIGNVAQSSASIRAVGGGLVIYADNLSEHRNCSITGNYFSLNQALGGSAASGGGIDLFNEGAVVQNNIIVRNKASVGGGIGIHGIVYANPVLINNTLAFNSTFGGGSGGGISCDGNGWNPIVLNTVVWGDTGAQEIGLLNGSQVRVQYSDISGGYTGTGNLNADPKFVISDSLYNLQSASPCIGRGIDSLQIGGVWYRAPAWDFAGRPRHRPFGPQAPDMGAQEEQTTVDVEERAELPVAYGLSQNYPNPFNPSTTIRYGLPHKSVVQLTIFNTLGQQVAVLQNAEQESGYHEVKFDASKFSSGVYFYRMQAGNFIQTQKMLLVR